MDREGRSVLLALSWYDPRVHRGVTRYAAARGWRLDTRMAMTRELAWGWRGDGVLCKLGCTERDEELVDLVRSLKLPTVDLSVFGDELGLASLEFDQDRIGELAAEHFASRGLTHFAFFPSLDVEPIRLRRAGFQSALRERGFKLTDLAPIAHAAEQQGWVEAEKELGKRLAELDGPVGVFCFNDSWAAQVIYAAERAGVKCPEQVAVLGVDNQVLDCEALPVPLSSVALDLEAWGVRAAEALDQLMGEVEARGHARSGQATKLIDGTVVARRSTDLVACQHEAVSLAVQFISDQLRLPLTVEQVAEAAGVSRSGLKQAFARHLGRSVKSEIERARLERTRRLLLSTEWSIERIAQQVGLSGARSLHRLFARHGGETPSQFRQRYAG